MYIQKRNNVNCSGNGPATIVFAHGFGCDQTMWRFLTPSFVANYRIVLFDLVGSGRSDLSAYSEEQYRTLHAHADDVLDIVACYAEGPVFFVGHSVSAMIGMLAAIKDPRRFAGLAMLCPSPCYINDGDYVGGFNREDIDVLLQLMHDNYLTWAARMGPVIMGAPDQPELQEELTASFCRNDPAIARHFARVTFLSDQRRDLTKVQTPTLILQSSDDLIAPMEVGEYMHAQMKNSALVMVDNIGHCPHLSAPSVTADLIEAFVEKLSR